MGGSSLIPHPSSASKADPPPSLPCLDCLAAERCVMRAALSRELLYAWLDGREISGCDFQEPVISDNYHGLEGVRA